MACCLSPSCCTGRPSVRRPPTKTAGRTSSDVSQLSKSVSPAVEASTPRTPALIPDVVDRLRRRICQEDGDGGIGNISVDDNLSLRTSCTCCRRCLVQDSCQQPAAAGMDHHGAAVSTVAASRATTCEPAPSTTADVGGTDFMTLFFRNCEKIVLDNAAAIPDMLAVPVVANQQQTTDNWTSEASSTTSPVERRRHLTDTESADPRSEMPSFVTGSEVRGPTENTDDTSSCIRTEGSMDRLVAPANSPETSGSRMSSPSVEVLATGAVTMCACSSPMKPPSAGGDRLFVRRRPSVSGQSPGAVSVSVSAAKWTADRRYDLWRMTRRRSAVVTTSPDDDNTHIEFDANQNFATNALAVFPVGLGSRPPCLGQECSPIRSTPCGAAPETSSSAATGGATSQPGGTSRPVLPPGRTTHLPVSGRRRKRRSVPVCPKLHRHVADIDAPSAAVVQQSYRKVDTWLQRQPPFNHLPQINLDDVTAAGSEYQSTPENQLKRKLICRQADSLPKCRVTDTDSCSLPSGTFTSDEDDQIENDNNVRHGICRVAKGPTTAASQQQAFPATPQSSLHSPAAGSGQHRATTLPRRRKRRRPFVNVTGRRGRVVRTPEAEEVSSGALGDRSSTTRSSLATSGEHCLQLASRCVPVPRQASVTGRKNSIEGRQQSVRRRRPRISRRLHRVAAADVVSGIRVQTLAVL